MYHKLKRNHPFYDSGAWRAMRRHVLARDGYRCTACGKSLGKGQFRIDHIKPIKQAPHLALVPANLRTLCAACDNIRHADKGGKVRAGHNIDGTPRDSKHIWNNCE